MKFSRIYIEITDICGLSCSFCPTKDNNNQIMSLDLFEDIIKQSKNFTNEIALHVMGDPLVLTNIVKYLDIIHANNMRAMVTTSGFYISNHTHQTLLHPAVRQLNISLNSYNKNSTKISLEKYLEPILSLCNEKIKSFSEPFINLRLWNIDKFSSENEFNTKIINRLEEFFGTKVVNVTDKKGFRLASKVILHFDEYFEWPSLSNQVYGDGYCGGLDSHIAILVDGRVVPCCLDYEAIMELGNIKHTKLENILNSQKSCAIKNGFKSGVAVEELCQKCSYKSRFE